MSTTQVLMVVFLIFFMFQSKVASRTGMISCTLACHVDEGTRTQEHADMEDDSRDYDYYRRYGDVPSPGIGH